MILFENGCRCLLSALAALTLFTAGAQAQAQDEAVSPASIEDAAWLAGRWVGEGLGGVVEETWAPPSGGQMVGHFRLVNDAGPVFYEIMLIDAVEDGLRLRVKHFNPDFTGWEAADEWHTFAPIAAEADALIFEGMTINRLGSDGLEIIVQIAGEGAETFQFTRSPITGEE